MVKLVVKKAFRKKENPSEIRHVGEEFEVTEEQAKEILENFPEYVEKVKAKPAPKKTSRKSPSKNEDDK